MSSQKRLLYFPQSLTPAAKPAVNIGDRNWSRNQLNGPRLVHSSATGKLSQPDSVSPPLILSVDDDDRVLWTRSRILQNAGYDALSASCGEDALVLFSSHDINLVVLDYQMPGMSGGLVILTMKMRRKNVPVVLLSSSLIPQEVASVADAVIEKGLGPAVLLSTVRDVLMRY